MTPSGTARKHVKSGEIERKKKAETLEGWENVKEEAATREWHAPNNLGALRMRMRLKMFIAIDETNQPGVMFTHT